MQHTFIEILRRALDEELARDPAVHLLGAAKVSARLHGRTLVTPDDVADLSGVVLTHRLVMTPEAELERFGPQEALRTALSEVPVPR